MRLRCLTVLAVVVCPVSISAQAPMPAVKTEVKSALVWGEDSEMGAISSTIQDPLTGNAIRKLSYGGIEVSSRLGFERISDNQVGSLLNYTLTIVNDTDLPVVLRYGGVSVDGHLAALLRVIPPGQKLSKRERKSRADTVELAKMHCFTSGFLSSDHVFSGNEPSHALTVAPKTAMTISAVIRDPRSYPLQCTLEGCYPKGTVRYYLTVGSQDYVFVWPGRSAVYCGK